MQAIDRSHPIRSTQHHFIPMLPIHKIRRSTLLRRISLLAGMAVATGFDMTLASAQDKKPSQPASADVQVNKEAGKEVKKKETVHVTIKRHIPCNLFNTTEPVRFDVALRGLAPGAATAEAVLLDESGREVARQTIPYQAVAAKAPDAAVVTVDFGKPGRGYYELVIKTAGKSPSGETVEGTAKASLGVMEFVSRTKAQVREGNYAFGLKWWSGIKNLREMEDCITKLGLQWTRIAQAEGGKNPAPDRMTSAQILTEFPMNGVIKVERFPKEMYDEARYGPLAEWEAKYGKGAWVLKTVPKKDLYQTWLRDQIAALPPEQQVFEIWNEPWDKMSPQDFATICGYVTEVILKDRPNAIIGPNLYGNTSPYEYDARVIEAGGMKGMKMVALHPYAGSEDRAWYRDYCAWLKQKLGRDMEIYITEYGSHSTPEGPAKRSEMEQSRRVVRQSLALYAEGAKALIPHWAGQSEQNPTYLEDWFGFFRKNEQPKPVLIAHANCARMVDGARYVGDLWYGPGIGAMVFEKNGSNVLVLWTLKPDDTPGAENTSRAEITVEPGVPELTQVDIMGREKKLVAEGGKVRIALDESPIYLTGLSTSSIASATKDLRPDRWPKPEKVARVVRKCSRMATPATFDGNLDEWKGATMLGLLNPKVNGADCSGNGYLAWDNDNLYIGLDIRDNEMLNKQSRAKLYRQDSLELFVSTEPRDSGRGYGPHDHQFFITPTSGEDKPIVGKVTDREAGTVEDVQGAKVITTLTNKAGDRGWAMEVAIPWTAIPGFKPAPGATLSLDLLLNDADTSHERFKLRPVDGNTDFSVIEPGSWSRLTLE
ncbi:hypothetical protein DB346_08360 [Verrucomicrobia bacterium LW23]|nr:hypothetical protein DB346_08360 [Verrucomicrobia bacterium LW23]